MERSGLWFDADLPKQDIAFFRDMYSVTSCLKEGNGVIAVGANVKSSSVRRGSSTCFNELMLFILYLYFSF